jgi:hypothetical protein
MLEGLRDAFCGKVDTTSKCWLWQGAINQGGYGQFSFYYDGKKRTIAAHRLAVMLDRGSIPDGLVCCHKCDNPRCVRPDHIFLGTHGDNARDAASKGRHSPLEAFTRLSRTARESIRYRHQQGQDFRAISREMAIPCEWVKAILGGYFVEYPEHSHKSVIYSVPQP